MSIKSKIEQLEKRAGINEPSERLYFLSAGDYEALSNATIPAGERATIMSRCNLPSWPAPQPCKIYLDVDPETV
jgi:hypothetical protein